MDFSLDSFLGSAGLSAPRDSFRRHLMSSFHGQFSAAFLVSHFLKYSKYTRVRYLVRTFKSTLPEREVPSLAVSSLGKVSSISPHHILSQASNQVQIYCGVDSGCRACSKMESNLWPSSQQAVTLSQRKPNLFCQSVLQQVLGRCIQSFSGFFQFKYCIAFSQERDFQPSFFKDSW